MNNITQPTFLLDEKKCKMNIQSMYVKAKQHGLAFRPHFKTHQSLEIGNWYKAIGVDKITVSSVSMAAYFSEEWDDITIAFPMNIMELPIIQELAQSVTLNLCVENVESIIALSRTITTTIHVFLKIDVGYQRTGVHPTDTALLHTIMDVIDANPKINFVGFLGHAGHTYSCKTDEAIQKIHEQSLGIMASLKATYKTRYPNLIISLGDTPSCSLAENFSGVDEIRPGNFVFYDLTQHSIGSCSISQIAVAMACPIVAIHKDRSEIVVYGGGVHFSKDRLDNDGRTIFGHVVATTQEGWGGLIPDMYVKRLSQEHGIINVPKDHIDNYTIGDAIIILPVHSCMTGNVMKGYTTLHGEPFSRL